MPFNNQDLYDVLGAEGYTGQINEREYAFLKGKGYGGQLNDMWWDYLEFGVYTGTLTDKFHAWSEDNYPVVLFGSTLITNGTFDTDLTGWSDVSIGSGSASVVGGEAVLTRIDGSNYGGIEQLLAFTIGRTYQMSIDISATRSAYIEIKNGNGDDWKDALTPGQIHVIEFTAVNSAPTITILPGSGGAGSLTMDNIIIREKL